MADATARASLFLDIVTAGVESAKQGLNSLAGGVQQIGGVVERAKQGLARLASGFQHISAQMQNAARIGAVGWGLLTVSLGAWVRSGMQGTAEAERLSVAFQQIGRAIADIFAPWIQKLADGLSNLAFWFRSLSGESQALVRQMVGLGSVLFGFLVFLPRVVMTVQAVAAAWSAVAAAAIKARAAQIAASQASAGAAAGGLAGMVAGAGAAAPLAAGVAGVALFAGLLSASREGREALSRLAESTRSVTDAFGNLATKIMDELGPLIERLSQEAAKAGNVLAENFDVIGRTALKTVLNWAGLGGLMPALDILQQQTEAEKARTPQTRLSQAGSGFGRPEDLYREIALAVNRGSTPADRTANAAELTAQRLEGIIRLLMELHGWTREQAMERARGLPGMGAP